jgi:hypothetical protein
MFKKKQQSAGRKTLNKNPLKEKDKLFRDEIAL